MYLFHGTVRENIAYGTFDASLDDIVAAAKIAEAHDFITELPDGYDTVVVNGGRSYPAVSASVCQLPALYSKTRRC